MTEKTINCAHCGESLEAPDVVWSLLVGYLHRRCWKKLADES